MPHDPDPRDPVLDASVVLGLARRHLPSARAVTAVDETGGEARAYVIDADFIFKTQRPHRVRPRTSLEKEAFHLDQLARHAPEISVPRVLGYGCQDGVEYLLMTRMPGVPMRGLTLAGESRAALLRELGTALRVMHGLEVEPFRGSGLFPGDADTAATRTRLHGDLERAVEAASAMRAAWTLAVSPEEAAARVRPGLDVIDEPPVPLHSNPGPEHVFVDPSTLRLVGVIDFGDAYLSHPALDFRRWARPADRAALMEGYAAGRRLTDSFWANWRAISVANLMLDFASRPSRRAESLEGLRMLLGADEPGGANG
jgi:aminoglycoside phosphotransferase (APT) family kinase protein